ncbi:unnamed protein product [Cuscuta epithymum]|uniref:Uncharacterized protein n=1 Tax=Cuscuta epithymum TaxID=186058 RepID=A0AAV0F5K3_9ASTE|nr:unnamed protein product [Cuscuta epithymum]CAH9130818.1 unnamed protein product [Cuscuta epithymum]
MSSPKRIADCPISHPDLFDSDPVRSFMSDWYFRETIVEYENKYDMRRNKHTFSDDAIEDAMHRIKNDIFCRHILEKREDIALLSLSVQFQQEVCGRLNINSS